MTDHANDWLWADWKHSARVLVPRADFVTGRILLSRLIETIPPPLLARFKATLSAHARRFQISLNDDDGDQVHMMLTGAMAALKRTARRIQRADKKRSTRDVRYVRNDVV